MNKCDVIDALSGVRKEIGNVFATLPILLELPLGSDDTALVFFATTAEGFDGDGFAIERIELGLVIEGIHVARAAIHEEENDRLRLGGQLGNAWGERIGTELCRLGLGKESALSEQSRERERGEATTELVNEFTTANLATEVL